MSDGLSRFAIIGEFGGPEIYRTAAQAIAEHGYSQFSPCDPYEGTLNAVGAIALACGAKYDDLKAWNGDPDDCPVKDNMWGYFMELVDFAEFIADSELADWCVNNDAKACSDLFEKCATRIEISVL